MKDPILSDADALRILVPSSGFIHDYVHYAYRRTDAPVVFHVGFAIAMLAAIAPPRFCVWADGSYKYPNLYLLIVGDSATARKSTALGLADDVLGEVAPERKGHSPGSYEGLLRSMEEGKPSQIIMESEFSRFLRQAQGQGHLNALKLGFLDLYDCKPISKITAHRDVAVTAPRLSLVGAIAPTLLEQYLERADLTGGFWSRFLILEGVRDRFAPWTTPDEQQRSVAVRSLARRKKYMPGSCAVHTPEVKAGIDAWATNLDQTIRDHELLEDEQRSLFGRASGLLHRMALLYAMDRTIEGLPADAPVPPVLDADPVLITPVDLRYAATLVGVHVNSSFSILADLADSKDMRDRRNVLRSIGSTPEGIGPISERAKLLKGRAFHVTDTLIAQGKVGSTAAANGEMHYFRNPNVAEADKPMDALAASLAWLDGVGEEVVPEQQVVNGTPNTPPIEPTSNRFRAPPNPWQPAPAGTVVPGPWAYAPPIPGAPED
jgi:hypothetical protein